MLRHIGLFAIGLAFTCTAAAEFPLSVMSFNIRYGTADDGPNSWEHRKELVAETIRDYDPDVVGTQECLGFQAEYLEEQLPAYRRFGMARNGDGTGERMEVFYKSDLLAPIEAGHFWLSASPEVPGSKDWEAANIRMVTWMRFYHLEREEMFYFFNTHFDHVSETARVNSAKLLKKRIRQNHRSFPVIVTGDFNAVAEKEEAWEILTSGRLKDAWLHAGTTTGPETTWSGYSAPEEGVRERRIDWILFGGPAEALWCETVTFNKDGQYPSDHFPVYARFRLGE